MTRDQYRKEKEKRIKGLLRGLKTVEHDIDELTVFYRAAKKEIKK